MSRLLLLVFLLSCAAVTARGQETFTVKGDSLKRTPAKIDTGYVNPGKIAARKAALRSAMIPGWGQAGNGLNVYRGIKIAAIYTGGTMLGISFAQNTKKYHQYLREIQYRLQNDDSPLIGNGLEQYSNTAGLITAKDVFRRNREVIIFSFAALYAVNIIEAYVDARLKFFDVGDNLAIKISPSMIGSGGMYGYNTYSPALKIGLRF